MTETQNVHDGACGRNAMGLTTTILSPAKRWRSTGLTLQPIGRCKLTKRWIVAGFAIVVAAIAPTNSFAQNGDQDKYVSPWKTPWDYEGARGPEHWSELDPAYAVCNTGKEQSPVDIRNAETADLPVLRMESKTDKIKYVTNNRATIRVNYPRGNGNFLLVGDQRYELLQFHFHHPSEEPINGKAPDMDVHLMYQTGDGKVAGVAVPVKQGKANSTIQKLWDHMPKTEGQQEAGIEVNPSALLPQKTGPYYMYMGSVTAPPCTERVTWFVLKHTIEMSAEQIDAFVKLYPNDARPMQPLNGRVVKQSR
jgi:carbonic anhydrase